MFFASFGESWNNSGHGNDTMAFEVDQQWNNWKQNENASACFTEDGFPYGIYVKAVNLTAENNIITRYVYSFFWGFQVYKYFGSTSPTLIFYHALSFTRNKLQ